MLLSKLTFPAVFSSPNMALSNRICLMQSNLDDGIAFAVAIRTQSLRTNARQGETAYEQIG